MIGGIGSRVVMRVGGGCVTEDDDADALVYYLPAPPNRDMHVYPLRDLQPHALTRECACHPRLEQVEGVLLITHNSFDGRELVERHGVN